ncbi:E3 ubiquitin/ISG15 ligase TRIM25 isoform X1 [Cyprinodon tularosa]|uniref:E3 ubiquitin/ISG15 ligase TRIM25 isoform X1 n=1 Tax=Cyprinodon tularosa TaxID=77115 RepID=UPI0018E22FCB|nr:E3 ubiquitin/ISG15 ligase TRIM25 isoform X1 [Cyprinodon tularosa]
MGASLDTPAKCLLCDVTTPNPVTLKCNHRFCRRCIGDLWSVSPNGPFHCPETRCKVVYQTLPFDKSFIRTQPPTSSRQSSPRSAAGTPSSHKEQSIPASDLRRPSLTSRILGKRKASTPVSEEHLPKRAAAESPRNTETPTTSSSDESGDSAFAGTSTRAAEPELLQFAAGDGKSPTENSDSTATNSDVPKDVPSKQNQQILESADDSDSSSEVDLCDAPVAASPKSVQCTTGTIISPKKPASPARSDSRPAGSNIGKEAPLTSAKSSAAASSSSSRFPLFFGSVKNSSNQVPCHYCPKSGYQPAVKTCLVCGASMCQEHLRPHLESPVFQNHTLVSPMEDISLWRCQEHQEINRIYCRQCATCVCTVCTVIGSHRDHECISIREAERELRANLKEEIKQLQKAEQQVKNRVTELTEKKETFRVVLSEALDGVKRQYGAIREALDQEEQSALQCVMKEESRVLGGLEQKLSLLQSSLQSIQNGLHTLEGLADARADTRVQDQAFILEYSKVSQLSTSDLGNDDFKPPEEVDYARLSCLQRWTEKRLDTVVISMPGKDRDLYRLLYGTVPAMDRDTAHPKLQLSASNRKVIYSESPQGYTEHDARFSSFPQVLASSALEGGRWYWEVSVSVDDGRWKVGLCEGQIERKGQKDSSRLGFNSYSWCLACDKRKLEAVHNKEAVPVRAEGLQRVGVFLDFEEGSLSFFNVTPGGSLALLHSFQHSFSEPLYPALSVSKTHLTICDLFNS